MNRRAKAVALVALCVAACGRFSVEAAPEVEAGAGAEGGTDAVADQIPVVEASADVESEGDVRDAALDVPAVACGKRGDDCSNRACCSDILIACLSTTKKCGTCAAFGGSCSATGDCCNAVNGALCGGNAIAKRCCWQKGHDCDVDDATDCCSGGCSNGKCQ